MVAPLIIRNPIATLTKLVAGVESGAAVDVSDDVSKVELTPSLPTSNVQTFSGKYQQTGDVEWAGSATIVHNEDLDANWTPLVGFPVRVKLYDRQDQTVYRTFDSEVVFNPALGGPTQPGQARTYDYVLPVQSQPSIVTPP
jgi:hypothetical protein